MPKANLVQMIYSDYEFLLGLLSGILVSFVVIPPIVKAAKKRKLVAIPNGRTSHSGSIPTIGGVAVFISVILGSLIFMENPDFREFRYVLAAMTIIFFVGLMDDVVNLNWGKKILLEILAAFLVVVVAGVRITTFHGMFGIEHLSDWFSIIFSIFVCIALVNSFNLLDGIDGLASGMAIFISGVFGYWLYRLGFTNYAILSMILTGALIPFFIFNVFGKKNKIFMGDCGSLQLGFLFSILAIKILCCEVNPGNALFMRGFPVVVMGVMIMPMMDTIRVFTYRLIRGKSPFAADRTHLHHVFLDLGFNHLQASVTIILMNIVLAFMTYLLRDLDATLLFVILFGSSLIISMVPIAVERSWRQNGKIQSNTPVHQDHQI